MKKNKLLINIIVIFLFMAGCVVDNIQPFTADSEISPQTEGERRLWTQAAGLVEAIKKSRRIYIDESLRRYMQSVMDKLYPEFNEKFQVYILDAPVVNAFALPDGSIFLCTGIIAAMENEAQIATVLAHEGVHFIRKHSALRRKMVRNVGGAAMIIPLFGDLAAISSICGYSREQEREADRLGIERMISAGYDLKETVAAFEHLAREARANKEMEPYFFSDHPKMQERIQWYQQFIEQTGKTAGRLGQDDYQRHVLQLRQEVIEEKISVGKYNSVIMVLTDSDLQRLYPDLCLYYLGEAYRLRNERGDIEQAIEAYEAVKNKAPQYAPIYKSLGIIYLKQKKNELAMTHFRKYLALCPECKDLAFIEEYIKQIREPGT